ncbi:TonB-dependent receptor domain-containing protein [Falsirhodobacter deserti]|uniref:TonB-dependent receptor domain-containing protein n=1 Tax=Falsirhodobacter deserti TaxID=1365611 RepID=UPI000FE3A827|nr:TonB-dependent receptor [Falsirhodobacter deserti]
MVKPSTLRTALLCGAAFLPMSVRAQEMTALPAIVVDSKRDVATDTAVPVTQIDQREIDDRQASTIAELIDSVPGVTLMNGTTPGGSGINIRGFGATGTYGTDQMVLIQVDGATQGSEELYRIGTQLYTDPALYKEVEVQRGTVGSFEYGSGVVGGLVRLQTKDASDFTGGALGWAGRQTLELGTNGDGITSSSILAWQPRQDLEFLAQFVWRTQDEQKDGEGEPTGAEGFTDPSYLLKGKYSFGDQSVALSFNNTETTERDVPYDQFGIGPGFFGNVDRDIRNRTTVLAYDWNPASPLWHVKANLSHADQRIDSSYVEGSSPGDMGRSLGDADHRYETTKLTVKNSASFATGTVAHDLRAGVEVIHKKRKEASAAPGGTDDRLALFIVDDARLGNWTFSPALRYETQDMERASGAASSAPTECDNDAVMGGLSIRHGWGNGLSAFVSGAYTETLPILDDFGNLVFMQQSQKARTWEIGAAYETHGLVQAGDAFQIKANLYHTDLWDVTSYSGIDKVETRGIEIEAAYSLANGFYADLNANIAEGDASADGTKGYWTNAVADRLRLTLGQRLGDELDLSWEAVANARFNRVANISDETPGSVIHNLRITYSPRAGIARDVEFRVGVENLFDTDYRPRLATRDAPGRNIKFTIAKTF